jgi:zinc protease
MSFRRPSKCFLSLIFALCWAGVFGMAPAVRAAERAPGLPPGVERLASVEGMTEYRLPNGLSVLLFPDPSKQTITVNITYRVGSRNEGYGETGMAHLLEHLMFKGSTHHRNIPPQRRHGTRRLVRGCVRGSVGAGAGDDSGAGGPKCAGGAH